MTPTVIAKDGKPVWVFGSPGGKTIISTNVQIAVNLIDFQMNVAEAAAAPQIYHGWLPDETLFQKRATTLDSHRLYEAMGHKVVDFPALFGPAMIIRIDCENNRLQGAPDPRNADGWAAGY